MRRSLTGIALLFVLISPVLVTYYWFQYRKSAVRHEIKCRMMEGMEKNELMLIRVTKKESGQTLRWEHPGEFEYNRQMYDVVETAVKGDTLYYWCWWDHEETRLNRQLRNLVENAFHKDPVRKEKQERLNTYFKSLFSLHLFDWDSTAPAFSIKRPVRADDLPSSLAFPPPKPPPRLG